MVHNSAKNGKRVVIHGFINDYQPVIKGYTHPVYIYVDNNTRNGRQIFGIRCSDVLINVLSLRLEKSVYRLYIMIVSGQ